MTNCINCGAVLRGNKCEYCGTEYLADGIHASFGEKDWQGTLTVGGNTYEVYIGNMECKVIDGPLSGRMMDGRYYRDKPVQKHKFTLIEL